MSEKACPRCQQRYPAEAVRCPRDGTALTVVAPQGLSQLVGRLIEERYPNFKSYYQVQYGS